ncbi:MAG: hypothetical protein M4579_001049 [Chaenotheca gracillima]|nr:MAG: hypothetical protein M4579_001049 [Chaenotheca gracillima]
MTKIFFMGWELWEKMCFVLGCSIVLTLLGGCVKLAYSRWKLRKYTKLAEANLPGLEEALREPQLYQLAQSEIPFGIRAIESGIEIDGVWISRPGTPVNGSIFEDHLDSGASNPSANPSPEKAKRSRSNSFRFLLRKPPRALPGSPSKNAGQAPTVVFPPLDHEAAGGDISVQPVSPIPSRETRYVERLPFLRRSTKKWPDSIRDTVMKQDRQGGQLDGSGWEGSGALLDNDVELAQIDPQSDQRRGQELDAGRISANSLFSSGSYHTARDHHNTTRRRSLESSSSASTQKQSFAGDDYGGLDAFHRGETTEAGHIEPFRYQDELNVDSSDSGHPLNNSQAQGPSNFRMDRHLKTSSMPHNQTIRLLRKSSSEEFADPSNTLEDYQSPQQLEQSMLQEQFHVVQNDPPHLQRHKTVRKINSGFEILPPGSFPLEASHIEGDIGQEWQGLKKEQTNKHRRTKKLQKRNKSASRDVRASMQEGSGQGQPATAGTWQG